MKDITGKTLSLNQKVVTNLAGYVDRLCVCKVICFTGKKVRVSRGVEDFLKFPKQLAIVGEYNEKNPD